MCLVYSLVVFLHVLFAFWLFCVVHFLIHLAAFRLGGLVYELKDSDGIMDRRGGSEGDGRCGWRVEEGASLQLLKCISFCILPTCSFATCSPVLPFAVIVVVFAHILIAIYFLTLPFSPLSPICVLDIRLFAELR